MTGNVRPIPEGFHTLTPALVVRNAVRAIEFYQQAFGAEPRGVHYTSDGKVMHADLKIGDSILMLSEEFPAMKCVSPQTLGDSSVTIHLYVEDVDVAFNAAVSAGATVTMPLTNAFWGDRYGHIIDPFGHKWSLATHQEDLTNEEIQKRGREAFAAMAKVAQRQS